MRLNVVKENKPIIHLSRSPNEKETHTYINISHGHNAVSVTSTFNFGYGDPGGRLISAWTLVRTPTTSA